MKVEPGSANSRGTRAFARSNGGCDLARNYTIQQGDHLSGIAAQSGFADFETIWNHANNASLKAKRKDPHVLFPGDTLFIPDPVEKTVSAATGSLHIFEVCLKPLELRVVLKDFDNTPIANAACVLEIDGEAHDLTSDSSGLIRCPIPRTAKKALLRVPSLDLELPCEIGALDPVEEDSGWKARLNHLGYYNGAVDGNDSDLLHNAIEEFQCDFKLKVTGQLDEATRAKIKETHGA